MKVTERIKDLFSASRRRWLFSTVGSVTAIYMLYTFVASVSTVNIFAKLNGRFFSDANDISANLRFVLALIWSLVILSSFVNSLIFNDTEYIRRFLDGTGYHGRFYKRYAFVLRSEKFWVTFTVLGIWSLIMPIREAFACFCASIYGEMVFSFSYLQVILVVLLLFVTILITYASALGWAEIKCSRGGLPEKKSVGRLIWKFAYTSLGFIVAATLLPLTCVIIYATVIILGVFAFAVPMGALAALLIFIIFKYWRGIHSRRRFMRKLRRICSENRFRLTNVRRIYSSLFFGYEGSNFTVEADGTAYTCKLVGIPHRKTPIYLDEEGNATYTHKVLFVVEHISTFSYFFEADIKLNQESVKIIVVAPDDQRVYAENGASKRKLELGDKVMDYRVYHASGFANALERRCVLK